MPEREQTNRNQTMEHGPQIREVVRKVVRLADYNSRAGNASPALHRLFLNESRRILTELEPLREDETLAEWSRFKFVQNKLGVVEDPDLFKDKENVAAYWCVTGKLPEAAPEQTVIFEAIEDKKEKSITNPKKRNASMPHKASVDAGQVSERVVQRRERVADMLREGKSLAEIRLKESMSKTLLTRDLNAIYAENPELRIRPGRRSAVEMKESKMDILIMTGEGTQAEIAENLKVTERQVRYTVASLREEGVEVFSPERTVTSYNPDREALYRKAVGFMSHKSVVPNIELAKYLGVTEDEARKIKRMVYHIRRRDAKKNL